MRSAVPFLVAVAAALLLVACTSRVRAQGAPDAACGPANPPAAEAPLCAPEFPPSALMVIGIIVAGLVFIWAVSRSGLAVGIVAILALTACIIFAMYLQGCKANDAAPPPAAQPPPVIEDPCAPPPEPTAAPDCPPCPD